MMQRRFLLLGMASLAALSACSTMPSREPTPPDLPAAWQDAPVGAEADLSSWWQRFNDPTLTALVDEALTSGPTIQIAASRIDEARGQSRSTIARYLPELSLTGQGQYTRVLEGDVSPFPGVAVETERATASYGPQVSWEIPLFARIEAAVRASRANRALAQADYRAARVALAADVAQAYVDLRAANNSRAALARYVDVADELARILDISFNAGIASEADAADARRLAESTRARLPGLVIEARRAENALATLRGLAPGTESETLRASLGALAPVPSLSLTEAPAAPADLLRLRPDVAAAEAQALLAAANLADARANLLPQLNLTGTVLASETLLGTPFSADGVQLSATPLISIPLFDWGARFGAMRVGNARFEQALIQYRQTVAEAVAEASLALTALDQGRLRLDATRGAEAAAEVNVRGARAAYEAGIQSLADRLRSEQQLIDATLSRIDAEAAEAGAAIATYRAFGGGAV